MPLPDSLSSLFKSRTVAVGLEIGTSSLKVVELRPGSPPHLEALAIRPMPPGLVQDDQVIDREGFSREIKALFEAAGITRKYVVVAISNRIAVTRNITVPKMPLKDVEKAIPWEAERFIPYPIDEVAFDYFILDNPKDIADDQEVEVIVAAARLDTINQLVEALKGAGLEPTVIDIKPFALMRALKGSLQGDRYNRTTLYNAKYTADGEIGVVVEVGASSTTITLVRDERVLMNRNLAVAGDDFTTALQRAFGLDFDTAEELKLQHGSAVPPRDEHLMLSADPRFERFGPGRVHDALRQTLNDFITEIRRSLEFFRSQAGDATISKMYLAGGGSKLRGLNEAIGRSLGLEVDAGDPWLSVALGNKFKSDDLERIAPEFGVPLGLAIRGAQGLD